MIYIGTVALSRVDLPPLFPFSICFPPFLLPFTAFQHIVTSAGDCLWFQTTQADEAIEYSNRGEGKVCWIISIRPLGSSEKDIGDDWCGDNFGHLPIMEGLGWMSIDYTSCAINRCTGNAGTFFDLK